jgi:hypothetical protein
VYRILQPGGVFLYTELMRAGEVGRNLRLLEEASLIIERDEDVTANVLLSCDENARQRIGRQGIAAGTDSTSAPSAIDDIGDFIALPGSRKYEEMRRGERVYRMMRLGKPD